MRVKQSFYYVMLTCDMIELTSTAGTGVGVGLGLQISIY